MSLNLVAQSTTFENSLTVWAPSVATGTVSIIGGAILGGPLGTITGLCASVLDEYLISQNIMDKHYLSTGAFWASTTIYPLANLALKYTPYGLGGLASIAISVAGLALPYLSSDFLDFREKLNDSIESFMLINKMFDKNNILSIDEGKRIFHTFLESPTKAFKIIQDDLYHLSDNKFFVNFIKNSAVSILKTCSSFALLVLLGSYGSNLFIHNLLSNNPGLTTASLTHLSFYLKEALKILSLLAFKNEIVFQLEALEHALSVDQYEIVLTKSVELLLKESYGRKILANEKGKELIQNLTPDLTKLIYRGANRLQYVATDTVNAIASLGVISRVAPIAIAPYALLSVLQQLYVHYISANIKRLFKKHSEGEVALWDVKYDISNHIDQITLRGGEEFASHQYHEILSRQNTLQKNMEYFENLKKASDKRTNFIGQSIDVYHFGLLSLMPSFSLGAVPSIKTSIENIYGFVTSNLNLEITSKELKLAKKRIEKLFEIINEPSESTLERTCNKEGKIKVQNYTLNLNGLPLLKIDNLELGDKKRYVIDGKSGCGKTSFLVDLKQGVLGKLSSSGQISIGSKNENEPYIMFIDQNLYTPVTSTLLQTVCFPTIISQKTSEEIEALKESVITYFREFEIDKFAEIPTSTDGLISLLDSEEFKLSGGQSKKVAIIQAILHRPDILIMDETFTGLDKDSLKLVQNALLKYLPDTMMLIVDHHAKDNNYHGFYESNLHFSKDEEGVGRLEKLEIEARL